MKVLWLLLALGLAGCGVPLEQRQEETLLQLEPKSASSSSSAAGHGVCTTCAHQTDDAVTTSGRAKKIVFLGDSLTHGWHWHSAWFQQYLRQNIFIEKGVGGDKSADMLARFQVDVLDLKPDVVVIMGGANDCHSDNITCDANFASNMRQMFERGAVANIRVVICTIMPVRYPAQWANTGIQRKNVWIRAYVAGHPDLTLLDYWPVVLDPATNELRASYAMDQVHLNDDGYSAITPLTDVALRSYWIPQ